MARASSPISGALEVAARLVRRWEDKNVPEGLGEARRESLERLLVHAIDCDMDEDCTCGVEE